MTASIVDDNFRQALARGDLPFSAEISNSETREAMRQALEGEGLKEWSDLEALKGARGMGRAGGYGASRLRSKTRQEKTCAGEIGGA